MHRELLTERFPKSCRSQPSQLEAPSHRAVKIAEELSSVSLAAGKCVGTAAAALGCVVNSLPSRPHAQEAPPTELLEDVLQAFLSAVQNASRLSQSNAAKLGVASGLAALLGVPHMLPGVSGGDTWLLNRAELAGHAMQALTVGPLCLSRLILVSASSTAMSALASCLLTCFQAAFAESSAERVTSHVGASSARPPPAL